MWKYFCGLCALFLLSCTSTSKEKTLSITEQTVSRPDSFASDSVMLDYIQRVHFNYMWDGAEKTSGLAPERIHLDLVSQVFWLLLIENLFLGKKE